MSSADVLDSEIDTLLLDYERASNAHPDLSQLDPFDPLDLLTATVDWLRLALAGHETPSAEMQSAARGLLESSGTFGIAAMRAILLNECQWRLLERDASWD